jgi:hypothetical protein
MFSVRRHDDDGAEVAEGLASSNRRERVTASRDDAPFPNCHLWQSHCDGSGIIEVMSNSRSRRFPVTVTQLPVTRCKICHRTVAYRPGNLSEVLTEHYRRAHPEVLGLPSGSR